MTPKAGYRGQPVFMLVVLLGGWIALRTLLWDPHISTARSVPVPLAFAGQYAAESSDNRQAALLSPGGGPPLHDKPYPQVVPLRPRVARAAYPQVVPLRPAPTRVAYPQLIELPSAGNARYRPAGVLMAASMNERDGAASPASQRLTQAARAVPPLPAASRRADKRWSGDAWLLLREDTTTAVTSGRGSYGQSQLGAVLRYNIAPSSPHRPNAYIRASKALAGARESEVAAGLAARPIPEIPIMAAAEMRGTHANGRMNWRPAAYAYTQLPEFDLPLDFKGEAYAQAGYVGGDFATAFADGQLRAERDILEMGGLLLRAGGGAWGGAQKGAERLDIGPSATIRARPGGIPARLSFDWRFRVAGDANPSSGPTLTIAAGF